MARSLVVGSGHWQQIVEHLRRGLGPEQIAFTLSYMPERVLLSHETIYTALYAMHDVDLILLENELGGRTAMNSDRRNRVLNGEWMDRIYLLM